MTVFVHELFEEQARQAPDAVAVRFGDREWTYAAANARTNRLARYLSSIGVGSGGVVAIAVPRSDLMVLAALAVMKAGGTYLYLDSDDPPERRREVLEASGARVLLVSAHGGDNPGLVTTVDVEEDYGTQPEDDLGTAIAGEQAAYLLFTSGSTGSPKGVLVSHAAVASYLGWCVDEYGLADGSGAPVASSLAFDLTVTSLFGPLVCGRTVVVVPEENAMARLARELAACKDFSILKLTPSHLLVLGEYLDPARLTGSVRTLILGGELLRAEALAFWREHAPQTRIVNEYGPTEATVGCCRHWVTADDTEGPVPIGTAAPTTELYLLDEDGRPTQADEVGELYISGSQLAIGYLKDEELTRSRFVDLAVRSGKRRRMYRTGDLARRTAGGAFMYMGRNDRQVKVRGYRVELGEIETALVRDPSVLDAHALLEDGILTAYVRVRGDGGARDVTDVVERLRRTLPPYMVPTRHVVIDDVPLTSNGKVDYRRLSDTGAARATTSETCDEMHEIMFDIWSTVLDQEIRDLDQNFFTLGGDSIVAIQMVALARERGVTISLHQVFAEQTIRGLVDAAAHVAALGSDSDLDDILLAVEHEAGSS